MSDSKFDLKMSDSDSDLKMPESKSDLKMSDDNKCFLCLAEMPSVKCPQACGAVACSWNHLQVHLSETTNGQSTSGVVTARGIIATNGLIQGWPTHCPRAFFCPSSLYKMPIKSFWKFFV
jgi:hypothetical protein